jgi:putative transposase
VRLLNWDRKYSEGLSWSTHEKIVSFAKERNLAFHSDSEKHAARSAYSASLKNDLPYLKFAQARTFAPELDASAPRLADGDLHEEREIQPSVNGDAATDVPNTIPAAEREGDRIPSPAPRRGGAKATAKAKKNRARNQARKQQKPETTKQPIQTEETRVAAPTMAPAQSASRLAELMADLD